MCGGECVENERVCGGCEIVVIADESVWGGEKEVKYVGRDGDSVDCVGRERWCEGRVF